MLGEWNRDCGSPCHPLDGGGRSRPNKFSHTLLYIIKLKVWGSGIGENCFLPRSTGNQTRISGTDFQYANRYIMDLSVNLHMPHVTGLIQKKQSSY